MFDRFKEGWGSMNESWESMLDSFRILRRFPILIVPFLVAQFALLAFSGLAILLAASLLFHKNQARIPGVMFGLVVLLFLANSIFVAIAASVVLKLVQQHESGKEMSLPRAIEGLGPRWLSLLAIGSTWGIASFLTAILTGRRSWTGRAVQKAERMAVFMTLPAIAWEGLGVVASVKKGSAVARKCLLELAFGYAASGLFTIMMMVVFFFVGIVCGVIMPTMVKNSPQYFAMEGVVWLFCMIIAGFTFYIEQIFCGMLYLWHLKWEFRVKEALAQGEPVPKLTDIAQPSLLDDVAEIRELSKARRPNNKR